MFLVAVGIAVACVVVWGVVELNKYLAEREARRDQGLEDTQAWLDELRGD